MQQQSRQMRESAALTSRWICRSRTICESPSIGSPSCGGLLTPAAPHTSAASLHVPSSTSSDLCTDHLPPPPLASIGASRQHRNAHTRGMQRGYVAVWWTPAGTALQEKIGCKSRQLDPQQQLQLQLPTGSPEHPTKPRGPEIMHANRTKSRNQKPDEAGPHRGAFTTRSTRGLRDADAL